MSTSFSFSMGKKKFRLIVGFKKIKQVNVGTIVFCFTTFISNWVVLRGNIQGSVPQMGPDYGSSGGGGNYDSSSSSPFFGYSGGGGWSCGSCSIVTVVMMVVAAVVTAATVENAVAEAVVVLLLVVVVTTMKNFRYSMTLMK